MPHVLNIIQSALPPRENEDEGDIEVPLDALDTFTLRKLQKFIEVRIVLFILILLYFCVLILLVLYMFVCLYTILFNFVIYI